MVSPARKWCLLQHNKPKVIQTVYISRIKELSKDHTAAVAQLQTGCPEALRLVVPSSSWRLLYLNGFSLDHCKETESPFSPICFLAAAYKCRKPHEFLIRIETLKRTQTINSGRCTMLTSLGNGALRARRPAPQELLPSVRFTSFCSSR